MDTFTIFTVAAIAVYGYGTLTTFGAFSRAGRIGIKQIVGSCLWPIWWLHALGLSGVLDAFTRALDAGLNSIGRMLGTVLDAIVKALSAVSDAIETISYGTEGRRIISLALGLFACGHFLASSWNACSGVACTGVAVKSVAMLFSPVSVGYLTWLISQYAVG
ncbi:hypothetical protein JQ616_13780 [Bradyrhizobium tropiciagri]|uniref:hypothetical protein n=1 Tax=Bradyrhizobium tropiciagri TaxID=312253 RepID=UPI001BAC1530|nr:hypothetical protein [Bradyrhizobium tropiciagri]MBR0896025.1 hypothetical protein [Bradyrhizobium tropiciagri]